jgi:dihydroorotase-like cyclic amidohydrolase
MRVAGREGTADLGVRDGRIAEIAPNIAIDESAVHCAAPAAQKFFSSRE